MKHTLNAYLIKFKQTFLKVFYVIFKIILAFANDDMPLIFKQIFTNLCPAGILRLALC